MMLSAAVLLAACGTKTAVAPSAPTTSAAAIPTEATIVASPTAAPVAVGAAHFVSTPPSASKVAAAQTDPWIDVVGFHEIGLRPGQIVAYQVTGTATASYTCNGKSETAAGAVGSSKSFTADASGEISDVIAVLPPRLQAGQCSAGYPGGIWGFRYGMLHLVDTGNNLSLDVPGMSGGA